MPAYRVEMRGVSCPQCQHGEQWAIVGPGDVELSQSWGDVEEAEFICEQLNDAFNVGRLSSMWIKHSHRPRSIHSLAQARSCAD